MANPKIGIVMGFAGVIMVLLPILVLFVTGGYESPVQQIYDTPIAPGLPAGLIITAFGASITAVGLIIYVRGMRNLSPYPSPVTPYRKEFRKRANSEVVLEEIEREISTILDEKGPTMEIRTASPPKASQARVEQTTVVAKSKTTSKILSVVTRGIDMVCKSCGSVNPLGSKICASCGVELFEPNPKALQCPVCNAPVDDSYRIGENIVCSVCFSELKYEDSG